MVCLCALSSDASFLEFCSVVKLLGFQWEIVVLFIFSVCFGNYMSYFLVRILCKYDHKLLFGIYLYFGPHITIICIANGF